MKQWALIIVFVLLLLAGLPTAFYLWERSRPEQASALREGGGTLLGPPIRLLSAITRGTSNGLEWLVTTQQVRRRNDLLEREVARLSAQNGFLSEELHKFERLDAGATLAEMRGWRMIPADVVARGPRRWSQSVEINRGTNHGIEVGDPVLHMRGLAGVVLRTTPFTATIQLLSDPQAAVGCVVLPERHQGIALGTGRNGQLEVSLADKSATPTIGDGVITSGMAGSLYPGGLVIGTVDGIDRDRFGDPVALVHPTVQFGRVEEVLVLKVRRAYAALSPTTATLSHTEHTTRTLSTTTTLTIEDTATTRPQTAGETP